jgi:hypothetical protein
MNRLPRQAHSTGAVESVNRWLRQTLADRVLRLGNRQRPIKLLDLLTVGYNHQDDEIAFAVAIRKYLETGDGRPGSISGSSTTSNARRLYTRRLCRSDRGRGAIASIA